MDKLLLIQFSSMLLTFFVGLMLAMSRVHMATIGVPAQMLSRYIGISQGVTFRVWLSKIRIEEAKRILISNPDATIEFVAEECGFSSRGYFQNLFKAETGFTPREWRLKMYGS